MQLIFNVLVYNHDVVGLILICVKKVNVLKKENDVLTVLVKKNYTIALVCIANVT